MPLLKVCFTPSSTISALIKCTSKDSVSASKATEISELFARYGMGQVKYIDPNLPRATLAGVVNVLDPEQIKTWSELSFCNNLGLVKTICNATNGINLLRDYTETLNDGVMTSDQIDEKCNLVENDPNKAVAQECASATDPDLVSRCKDSGQRDTLIQEAKAYCAGPAIDQSDTGNENDQNLPQ